MQLPTTDLQPTLPEVRARFTAWRKNRNRGRRIPEELWSAAVELAKVHTLSTISLAVEAELYGIEKTYRLHRSALSSHPLAWLHCHRFTRSQSARGMHA